MMPPAFYAFASAFNFGLYFIPWTTTQWWHPLADGFNIGIGVYCGLRAMQINKFS